MEGPNDPLSDQVSDEDQAELVYKWTIRVLYAVAIGLNAWLLVKQMQDDAEWEITKRRWSYSFARWKRRVEPYTARLDFRRHADNLIEEAERTVADA